MLVKSPQRPKLDLRMAFVLAWGSQKTRSELGFLPSIVVGGSPAGGIQTWCFLDDPGYDVCV